MNIVSVQFLSIFCSIVLLFGCGGSGGGSGTPASNNSNQTPVILLLGESSLSIQFGSSFDDPGATATDHEDGDISADIVIGGDSVNTLVAATYNLSYSITDSDGASASTNRTVTVESNQTPEISIIGDETVYIDLNNSYVDAGATATDAEDGDLTSAIITDSNVDTASEAEYHVNYSVTDSAGETANATRTVIVAAGQASSDVEAEILSLTRVNGVHPETIQFDADTSTCADCNDIWGLNTVRADAYSALAYHFNFDDSDSGSFATTGNSRNQQVGGVPRASHTFACLGETDPNWDATDQRCEFNVGVRVQAPDNDYDDAFIQVNIQPTHGTGGYYANENIYCVSSSSDFSDCPHQDAERHLTDSPAANADNYHGNLILFHNDGATYANVCVGADEYNVRVGTYGTGARPVIPKITSSGNPTNTCSGSYNNDNTFTGVNMIAKDTNGHINQGFGFNQVFYDLKVGEVDVGETSTLNGFHNLDMDWEETGTYDSYFSPANGADGCIESTTQNCLNLHYPYGLSLTDSVLSSNDADLAGVNFFGANGFSGVNYTVMGTSMERAVEHNIRVMGSWGAMFSNLWLKGNHVGVNGAGGSGKHRLTIREPSVGIEADINKNPEDFASNGHLRGISDLTEYVNHYNNVVDVRFGQEADGMDPEHNSAAWFQAYTQWGVFEGGIFIDDNDESGGRLQQLGGRYLVTRDTTWTPTNTNRWCTAFANGHADPSDYLDSSTVWYESDIGPVGQGCTSYSNNQFNTPTLPVPAAPGS